MTHHFIASFSGILAFVVLVAILHLIMNGKGGLK